MQRDQQNLTTRPVRVQKARPQDAGRSIVRIDPEIVEAMCLRTGDVVQVKGDRTTVASVYPGYPDDAGSGVVRMDGVTRSNAGVGIDDKVEIERIRAPTATSLSLAPVATPVGPFDIRALVADHIVGRPARQGDLLRIEVMGQTVDLVVTDHAPKGDAVLIGPATALHVAEEPAPETRTATGIPRVTYEDIGGLQGELKRVREMIELPLRHPEVFRKLGVEPPKGVLLHGPPGTGKTLLAKAVANETQSNFFHIGGPEIMSKFHGQSEENLRELFDKAREQAPSIIFLDEIDAIAPKRDDTPGETERRVVAQLLSLMDGLEERGRVVVIAATNRPDSIDPALRRPGRFDREIEIGVPDKAGRRQILDVHTRSMPLADDVDLDSLAARSHGFVGADLASLAKEAALEAVRRVLPELDLASDTIPAETLDKLTVTRDDLERAFTALTPSAMREVAIEVPDVTWDDVGGLEAARQELAECIEWPLRYGGLYDHMGAQTPRGVLLHGPPGTGKTLLAKALAHEAGVNFVSVKGPELLSKWVGDSEKGVREVFRKARQNAPCIVFLDEVDALAPRRGGHFDSGVTERVVGQLLTELDGLESLRGVLVLGATNRRDLLDDALLRPGRFDRIVAIQAPDEAARKAILAVHGRRVPWADDVDVTEYAQRTDGWSGAELAALCHEAVLLAIRRAVQDGLDGTDEAAVAACRVTGDDLDAAFDKVTARRQAS
ncbi:MAG: CDC48 family AAA ATPase [Thermoplasmatota archaeon]